MPKQRATREPPREVESTTGDAAGRGAPPGVRSTPKSDSSVIPENQPPGPEAAKGASPERAGVDSRHRGWYWHWNGIVTQYAPLIGLKGVGLLNSYTVWTDRREQSPTHGYAFPSQQSEADFYGEDRSELIAINKILVALDLVEIRKEMVQRIDAQGRKWKVPHNLYRVKDRPEGLELRASDVLRVTELASRDAAVFRYVKRIFSSRFAPIDRENVWHRILAEVAGDPVWQAMTDKTAGIEARASARTRAGHKARGKQTPADTGQGATGAEMTDGHSSIDVFNHDERVSQETRDGQTPVGHNNNGSASQKSDVAATNTGSDTDVDAGNTGSQSGDESSAEATNNGPPSVVAPSNATYYQETPTTTTTTGAAEHCGGNREQGPPASPDQQPAEHPTSYTSNERDKDATGASPGPAGLDDDTAALQTGDQPSPRNTGVATAQWSLADAAAAGPVVDPGPLVISLFEAANDRRATPLERMLLGELARDIEPAARACGESGADWVAAALREAVSSGSAFVAPKRIQEILNRWAGTGLRPGIEPVAQPESTDAIREVKLPRGKRAGRVWQAVLDEFSRVLDSATHERLFRNSRIGGYRNGVVTVVVDLMAESKLSLEYRPMLQRHLEQQLGRAVTVEIQAAQSPVTEAKPQPPVERIEISKQDAEQGRQLWRAVLAEIEPVTSLDDLKRLRGALPLGQDASGDIVVGAPTSVAVRLIGGRCRRAIEDALRTVLGDTATVKVIGSDEWSVREVTWGEE